MKFKFSLEAVLSLREQKLEALKEELASLKATLAEEEKELEGLRGRRRHYLEELRAKQKEGLSPPDILRYEDFLSDLEDRIHLQRKRVDHLKRQLEQKRQEVILASQELKTVERLKEKRLAEFLKEIRRQEGIFLDEFGLRRRCFRV